MRRNNADGELACRRRLRLGGHRCWSGSRRCCGGQCREDSLRVKPSAARRGQPCQLCQRQGRAASARSATRSRVSMARQKLAVATVHSQSPNGRILLASNSRTTRPEQWSRRAATSTNLDRQCEHDIDRDRGVRLPQAQACCSRGPSRNPTTPILRIGTLASHVLAYRRVYPCDL